MRQNYRELFAVCRSLLVDNIHEMLLQNMQEPKISREVHQGKQTIIHFRNEDVTIAVVITIFKSNCKAPDTGFSALQRDSNQWPLRSRCTKVLCQLSYEDPYRENRPMY